MDNALITSPMSAASLERLQAWNTRAAASHQHRAGTLPGPEPPSLELPPRAARAGALGLSALAYLGVALAGLALARTGPAPAPVRRTVALILGGGEPPPPAGPAGPVQPVAGGTLAAAAPVPAVAPAPEPEPAVPDAMPSGLPTPVAPVNLAATGPGSGAGGPAQAGVGGPGGVPGGVPGGRDGGHLGAVLPPRFDAAYLRNPEPDYPSLSRRLGEEGRVLLRVLVNPDGLPEQLEIHQSSGHARLDQAALATVRHWRFSPARRGSDRLAAWVLVPLSFQLDA